MSSCINAKEELLEIINKIKREYGAEVLCASINFDNEVIELNKGYIEEEFDFFLSRLDFEYQNGYGIQGLFGVVWLTNGVWLDRGEYDGAEWWELHVYPQIPYNLLINESVNSLNP
jgi:hypothetical protein